MKCPKCGTKATFVCKAIYLGRNVPMRFAVPYKEYFCKKCKKKFQTDLRAT
jgi:predicted nucleic-acid-binding Zn-ribbon protein